MKKLFLITFSLFFLFSSGVANDRASLQSRVQTKLEAQEQPILYVVAELALRKYYGRVSFADPKHETGWYRVDDFLKWLKKNARSLEGEYRSNDLQHFYHQSSDWRTQKLWIDLGARYIVDVYQVKAELSRFKVSYCSGENCTKIGSGQMLVSPEQDAPIPALINLGMHEITHMFPYLINAEKKSLCELATFYSQYNYGLPVKATDAASFGQGIRDIRRTYALKGAFELGNEYNYFIAGILLNSTLKRQELLEMSGGVLDEFVNVPIWMTIANLIAVRDGNYWYAGKRYFPRGSGRAFKKEMHFTNKDMDQWRAQPEAVFYVGKYHDPYQHKVESMFVQYSSYTKDLIFSTGYKRLNQQEYLELFFGDKTSAVSAFYDAVLMHLPKEVVKAVRDSWPVQTDRLFLPHENLKAGINKFGKPYSKQIAQAIVEALRETGAPPVPPLPEGYI